MMIQRTLSLSLLSLTLATLPVLAQAQESKPLTLSEAIVSALRNQPTLTAASASKDASAQRVKQSESANAVRVTPSYNYNTSFNYGPTNAFVAGNILVLNQGRETTVRREELNATYRLFDNGSRALAIRSAKQSLTAAELSEQNTKQTVIGNVADTYYGALRAEALVKVSEAQVARAEQTSKLVQAQVKAGTTRAIDTFQADADLLNAQVNLLQSRNNADIAHTQLRNAMGIGGSGRLQVADVPKPDVTQLLTAKINGLQVSTEPVQAISSLIQSAMKERPDVSQSEQNVKIGETGVKQSKLATQINLTGDLNAGLGFDAAQTSEAQLRATEAQLASQRQQVLLEVEQAYRNLALARVTLPATELAEQAAQKNFAAASKGFAIGTSTIIDVITAQTALVQAQTNYVQAFYSFYTADARLARSVGQAERIAQN
jgi:outer membrane protein